MSDRCLLIDVSSCQAKIDFVKLKAWRGSDNDRVVGVIAKCGQGDARFPDPQFSANWKAAREHGFVRGAYWFGKPDLRPNDALDEANRFVEWCDAAGGWVPGEDFFALDIETESAPRGKLFTDWVIAFCERVTDRTSTLCGVYTGGPYFDSHDGDPDPETLRRLARFWLWIAAYVKDPQRYIRMLAAWRDVGAVMHQISGDIAPPGMDVLHVAGIGTDAHPLNVDRDYFNGDEDACRAWVRSLAMSAPARAPQFDPGTGPDDWRPQDAATVLRVLA